MKNLTIYATIVLASLHSVMQHIEGSYNVMVWSVATDEASGKFNCIDNAVASGKARMVVKATQERPTILPPGFPYPGFPGTFFVNTSDPTMQFPVDCIKYPKVCSFYSARHQLPAAALTWQLIVGLENQLVNVGGFGQIRFAQFQSEAEYRTECALDSASPAFDEATSAKPSMVLSGCTPHTDIIATWYLEGVAEAALCTDEQRYEPNSVFNMVRTVNAFTQSTESLAATPPLFSDNPAHFNAERTYYLHAGFAVAEGRRRLAETNGLRSSDRELQFTVNPCLMPFQCDNGAGDIVMLAQYPGTTSWTALAGAAASARSYIISDFRASAHVSLDQGRNDGSALLLRGFSRFQQACPNGVNQLWKQCGGHDFTGSTCCVSGAVCNKLSEWYSQCIPEKATVGERCDPDQSTILFKCAPGLTCTEVNPRYYVCK